MTRPAVRPTAPRPAQRRAVAGFTLVELMIGVLVLGILAALAMPSFLGAIQKSRRADAIGALAALSQTQERFRTNNPAYADALTASAAGIAAVSGAGHYAITVVAASAAGYVATAVARTSSPQYGDRKCRTFRFELDGLNFTQSSEDADGVRNAAPDPCWVR